MLKIYICTNRSAQSLDPNPKPTNLQLRLFNRSNNYATDNHAVCNDGTSGGYYFSEAMSETLNNTYLIYLRGGGQCYDEFSCNQRWIESPSLMSSKFFSETIELSGIFDSNPVISPSFWGAKKFALAYCSSDGYIGDVNAANATFGLHFRGQRLVFEFIRYLVSYHGMNSQSKIFFAGGSAGARGVMALMDLLVAEHLPVGARVVAFLDSPFYIDIAPYSASFVGFAYQEQQKFRLMNTRAALSRECILQYPGEEGWKCQFGEYRMPFLQTPYFLIASQDDSYQLYYNTGSVSPPYSSSDMETYSASFAARTQELVSELSDDHVAVRTEQTLLYGAIYINECVVSIVNMFTVQSSTGYYSWACYNHDVSIGSAFYKLTTSATDRATGKSYDISQRDALELYLKQDPYIIVTRSPTLLQSSLLLPLPAPAVMDLVAPAVEAVPDWIIPKSKKSLRWIDTCTGFMCGKGCGPHVANN